MPKSRHSCFILGLAAFFLTTSLVTASAETMILKVLAINPSKDKEQDVPIKTYLPAEAKPETVLNRDDLEIGFDTEKSLYYVQKNVKLKPGESYTMQVEMNDIWTISQEQIAALRMRADEAIGLLEGAYSYEVAKLLYDNILQTLKIVVDHQSSSGQLPQEHIANYRLDIKLLEQVKKDLTALEEMTKAAKIGKRSPSGTQQGKSSAIFGSLAFSWKLILLIIGFLAVLSFGCFFLWQNQLRHLARVKEIDPTRTKFTNPEHLQTVMNADKMGEREMKLQALYEDADETAKIDAMTKINNRRHFFEILQKQMATAELLKSSFWLVMCDLDHFKQINDQHGHNFGDQVITATAQAIKQNLGPYGHVGRYGGDEFIMILDKTNTDEVQKRLGRMSDELGKLRLTSHKGEVKISMSFGAARFESGKAMKDTMLIEAADKELMKVKQTSRGKISVA